MGGRSAASRARGGGGGGRRTPRAMAMFRGPGGARGGGRIQRRDFGDYDNVTASSFRDQAAVDELVRVTSLGGERGPNAILRSETGAWQSRNEVVSGDSSMMGPGGPESRVQREAARKANRRETALMRAGFSVFPQPDPIARIPVQQRRDAWDARNRPATSMAQTRRQERQRREMEG